MQMYHDLRMFAVKCMGRAEAGRPAVTTPGACRHCRRPRAGKPWTPMRTRPSRGEEGGTGSGRCRLVQFGHLQIQIPEDKKVCRGRWSVIAAGADTNTIGKSISEGCQRSRGQVRREVQVDAAGFQRQSGAFPHTPCALCRCSLFRPATYHIVRTYAVVRRQ